MYLARETRIDFVAHHEIQFQAGRAVYEELSKVHDCRALIGQDATPTGAAAAVLLDHSVFQPRINKRNYTTLVHMSHDLSDWDAYKSEQRRLAEFDLILVPGDIHSEHAKKFLGAVPVVKIGWPKLEAAGEAVRKIGGSDGGGFSIIYAPGFVGNREWVRLLPELMRSGHRIIVKNHVYYDYESGVAPPRGSEAEYKEHIDSLLEMEEFISKSGAANVEYVDRRSNLCAQFPRAHALISDSSSANLEFIAYGMSIETGRYGKSPSETRPCSSLISKRVKYLPVRSLVQVLKKPDDFRSLLLGGVRDAAEQGNPFIHCPPNGPAKHAASHIDLLLYLKQNNERISVGADASLLGKARKWLLYTLA